MELIEDINGMLQRDRPVKRLHNVNDPSFGSANPICKVHIIWNCGAQHDNSDVFRQHDNGLLPDNASLLIINVMDFVEDDPLNVSDHLCASVKIVSKNFCGHDHATCLLVHADVTCDDSDVLSPEFHAELSVFLIGKGLYRRSVNYFTFMLDCQGHSVFCDDGLTSAGVSGHKDTLFPFQVKDGSFLELIEFKFVLASKFLFRKQVIEVCEIRIVFNGVLMPGRRG